MIYQETDGDEYDTFDFSTKLELEGLIFEQTCSACPEQYDVFDGENQIGYVRLRWGHLSASYPDVGGSYVYSAMIGDGGWTGMFTSVSERKEHLTKIALILKERHLEKHKEC